jgi:hypothetical protein
MGGWKNGRTCSQHNAFSTLAKNAQRGQGTHAKSSFAHREFQAFRSFRVAYSVTNSDIYVSSGSDVLTH